MDKISQKKMVERKNIAKTTKTKYVITKFWWWSLKIRVETILGKVIWVGKLCDPWMKRKKRVFQNHLKTLIKKNNLVHPCIVSVIPLYNNPDSIHCLMNIFQ